MGELAEMCVVEIDDVLRKKVKGNKWGREVINNASLMFLHIVFIYNEGIS